MIKMYRVKPGYRHGAFKQYGSGDIVGPYTDKEAAGFLDKLEPVATEAEAKAVADKAKAEADAAAKAEAKAAKAAADKAKAEADAAAKAEADKPKGGE